MPRKRKLDETKGDEQQPVIEGAYKCHICGQSFYRGCGLASHLRRHAPVTFDCEHCDYTCKHKYAYDRHLQYSHPELLVSGPLVRYIKEEVEDMPMPVLERENSDDHKIKIEKHTPPPPPSLEITHYGCPICPSGFDYQPRAAFHILCHRQKMYQAPKFSKFFSRKIGIPKIGFRFESRLMVKWRLSIDNRTIEQKRARVMRYMEENFGHPIYKIDQENGLSSCVNPLMPNLDLKTESNGVCPTIITKKLTMKCGTDFGQRLIFNNTHYYLCRQCPYVSWNVSSLWRHFRHHIQRSKSSWTCIVCPYSSSNRVKVDLHVKLHKDTPESDLEYSNWLRYERRVNKSDLKLPSTRKRVDALKVRPPKLNDMAGPSAQPVYQPVNNRSNALKREIELTSPMLQSYAPPPKLIAMDQFDYSNIVVYKSINPFNGGKPTTLKKKVAENTIYKPKTAVTTVKVDPDRVFILPKTSKFYRPETPGSVGSLNSDDFSSSSSSSPKHNEQIPSTSSEPLLTLRPPKYEDFIYMETDGFRQERHAIETRSLYERAKKDYEKLLRVPKYESAGFNIAYKDLNPLAKAQYGRNNPREYLSREIEIERSRRCADCPFKNNDLARFRLHRDKHYYGGPHKCKECNYACFDRHQVEEHMFVDHYLTDVKLVEGLSSSESEDEETPPPQEKQKKKPGRRGRRRANW